MPKVRLLSLNLHCLVEPDIDQKQQQIVDFIQQNDIDIITFQEVAQTETAPLIQNNMKDDNYAFSVQSMLEKKYHLLYLPIKRAFNKYDEGLAILSKYPIQLIDTPLLSNINDYNNWKRRMALIAYIEELNIYVSTVHLGWTDELETWESQLDHLMKAIPLDKTHILTGDFNITPDSDEYQYLLDQKWLDLFKDTPLHKHPTHIDDMDIHINTSKIDYILSNKPVTQHESRIVFKKNRVSDHYGLYTMLKL
jgi:maltose 6'-phosphate phosphatase